MKKWLKLTRVVGGASVDAKMADLADDEPTEVEQVMRQLELKSRQLEELEAELKERELIDNERDEEMRLLQEVIPFQQYSAARSMWCRLNGSRGLPKTTQRWIRLFGSAAWGDHIERGLLYLKFRPILTS